MPDNARSDRYEPLPGLTELPGYFLGKLSPRGRRAAAVIGALLGVAVAVGLYSASRRSRAPRTSARARGARAAHARYRGVSASRS